MQLKEQNILGLYSDTSLQEVELAFVSTDGLDVIQVENSFNRPYPYELKDKLLNIEPDQLADKMDDLNHEVTDFFKALLTEALAACPTKPAYLAIMGPVIQNSVHDKHVVELGDLAKIATTFSLPTIGHFMQSDLTAGGVGSPLKAVFWETMAKKQEKPLVVINVGGILKLTYLGPNGEMIGFDVGPGLALMDEWVFRKTGQTQDEGGWLSAKGKADEKVVSALLNHPFLRQKPPKSVDREKFNVLLEQLDGLSASDGCATLIAFFKDSLKNAEAFLPARPLSWIITGGGLKNTSLILALKQAFPHVQKAGDCFDFHEHLNAIGIAFLGARHLMNLPISLPTTTGVPEALSVGEVFDPELDK